jgi:glycosyltransferase involved in cell wall biosynthesis
MAVKPTKPGARARTSPSASTLSVVIPLFNEATGLPDLHERIAEVARYLQVKRGLNLEVIYVDDGSSDGTSDVARSLPAMPLDIQVVTLSRNFGKEAALLAGLDHARPGAVLFMDGDGQHPPDLIDTLITRWLDDGYDVVYTAKAHRENESWLRRTGVRSFYALLNWGARHKIPEDAELDRLSPGTGRLRAGPARAWRYHLERLDADRIVDRGADVLLGSAAACREPAGPADGIDRPLFRQLDRVGNASLR